MKKILLAMALIVSMGVAQTSWAASTGKHRYHAKQETVQDSKDKSSNQDAVEAFSDTTSNSVDSVAFDSLANDDDATSQDPGQTFMNSLCDQLGTGSLVALTIFAIVFSLCFIFAPLIIIFLILRYLYRRHQDRVKLMEMAMEKGVDIPESVRPIDKQSNEYLVKRGLRNAFLGLGLCVMFLIWEANFLAGIGALVFFYGAGQALIGSLPHIKKWMNDRNDRPTV